ncbi:MAG: hypothetical protein IRY99_21225 [Isosphaeraceae bacterium]|nr:hypothetical protein [Isosphaeraceae bacterium]
MPPLPLLLWETPPGLEQVLAQEGIAHRILPDLNPLALAIGRFVLFDGRRIAPSRLRAVIGGENIPIDIDQLRQGERIDPFVALIDTEAGPMTWRVEGLDLTERVARYPKGAIRHRLLTRLRALVAEAGGIWARIAPYPFPYRSAFNLRLDLDEPDPDDYMRLARVRRPLEEATTHFVSTHAYGRDRRVLEDLRRLDTQSHAHYHVVYRDAESNRKNLERAHALLVEAGITPVGFAAPEGRWNAGLDQVLEDLGYLYSSDFQVAYDDWPAFPWRGGRFSKVLQVPVHPVCEGLFFEAGARDGRVVADYLGAVVRARLASGDPAFVYGHPERRLGRHPEIVAALADAIAGEPLLWRVTLTEFARWWRWRLSRRWAVVPRAEGRFEVQFDEWEGTYPLALEIFRGEHIASIPLRGPRSTFRLGDLAYERRRFRIDLPEPRPARRSRGLKAIVRTVLDWETVTPVEELPEQSLADRLKKGLRRWRAGAGGSRP